MPAFRPGTCRSWPTSAVGRGSACRSWGTAPGSAGDRSRKRRGRSSSNGSCRCRESRSSRDGTATGIGRASTCRPSDSRSATGREAFCWTAFYSLGRCRQRGPRTSRRARSRSGWCVTGGSQPQVAAAVSCRLAGLAEWAERETTARIAALTAVWISHSDGDPEVAEVLVLGPSGRLPTTRGDSRFWGVDLLIPIGFRVDPELSESAIRRVVGARPDDLVLLDNQGPELIPREAFQPLSRAAIRLACAGITPGRAEGGRRP